MFTDEIRASYRVVRTQYGNGEWEDSIPLGSWRKGRGLAGKRGHVYVKGQHHAGVWLIHGQWPTIFASVQAICPSARLMQCGQGEVTFSVAWPELDDLLPLIWAKKRRVMTEAMKTALAAARKASPLAQKTWPEAGI